MDLLEQIKPNINSKAKAKAKVSYAKILLSDVTADLYTQFRALNMGNNGEMRAKLAECSDDQEQAEDTAIYYAEIDNIVVGWVLVFYQEYMSYEIRRGINGFAYIDKKHRRKGIGGELVHMANLEYPECCWHPWEKKSSLFYLKQSRELGKLNFRFDPKKFVEFEPNS